MATPISSAHPPLVPVHLEPRKDSRKNIEGSSANPEETAGTEQMEKKVEEATTKKSKSRKRDNEAKGKWWPCFTTETELRNLEAEGFIKPGSWRTISGEQNPAPEAGEWVVTKALVERGFSFPPSDFFSEILKAYELQPHHIAPNNILGISNHAMLCEGHLEITPELPLFQYYFSVKKEKVSQITLPPVVASPSSSAPARVPAQIVMSLCEETKDSIGQDKILKGASSNSSSLSHGPHICLMAKGSTVPPTMEPNMSRGDKNEDEYEEEDWVVSLRDKGESVFKVLYKDKIASSHFFEILTTAIESQKLIWMHENTIDKKGALEREYANDVASLKNDLEEEQETIASLEEQLETLEVSQNEIFAKLTKERDHAKAKLKLLKNEKSKVGVGHDKLVKDLDDLDKAHKALESEHSILTKSYEQLQASYLKEHAMLPSLLNMSCDDACATNSTSCEASILKENVELRAQLELLTSNYGKLEENHGKLSSSHEDLLASHDRLKLAHEAIISKATPCSTSSSTCVVTNHVEEIKELKAQVTSLKNDLVKSHEGKCKLDKMLSVQQSPNDKSGLGFNSNNKNKSKNNKTKKGQLQVKDPAKIVCFKCKIEGHHVRSCPLKKKQKGKRPQAQTHIQPQVEEMPLPKKNQANAPIVEKSSEKKEKKRTCYICREKGHISSFCTIGTSSNSITINDVYSLRKDEGGNVFAKYVGAQSGVKKRTIWVAKPIVTNLLGPNLVGDQQSKI
ncbi:hypothetical protein QYE76_024686 [Lolium multiflorum]|uniref:CCHC-type domain-containing protein n=1 Tax=Lolium multiflorum TaxID=4521 RepID=A0AAD8RGL2_LOLMU|nr:hypothetical protein QYE76_024686 [Lolium multiflorum]